MIEKFMKAISDGWKNITNYYYIVWGDMSLDKFLELSPMSESLEGDFRRFTKFLGKRSYYDWLVIRSMFYDKELEVLAKAMQIRRDYAKFVSLVDQYLSQEEAEENIGKNSENSQNNYITGLPDLSELSKQIKIEQHSVKVSDRPMKYS